MVGATGPIARPDPIRPEAHWAILVFGIETLRKAQAQHRMTLSGELTDLAFAADISPDYVSEAIQDRLWARTQRRRALALTAAFTNVLCASWATNLQK